MGEASTYASPFGAVMRDMTFDSVRVSVVSLVITCDSNPCGGISYFNSGGENITGVKLSGGEFRHI
jgi:hypothetical protein